MSRPKVLPRLLAVALALVSACVAAEPVNWVWAWDRPEDLRWLPPDVGVAWFAGQFDARGEAFRFTGRRAVLRIRPETKRMPVLHIEAFDRRYPPVLDDAAVARWSDALFEAIRRLDAPVVQIDFEARSGQQRFYRDVLAALRGRLPAAQRISATALASWCGDAAWVDGLPVDELVPMYFRMGAAERGLWQRRMRQSDSLPRACRKAAGIATDEWTRHGSAFGPDPMGAFAGRVLYLFSPRSWQPDGLRQLSGWPRSVSVGKVEDSDKGKNR
ncbi:hypothetical protein [Tahibacter amnicola]|uniref:DUF3142 domain-containing protein n=1 Tax=Tahibacter amnicola TaxID=2976241 RepID=A0ABY6BJB4_9GAMM|nr:hypothetical protein [Tahibacter amnicola]UXI70101.1 hypothetical protein N4264_10870 [Tahibacter amnicola]